MEGLTMSMVMVTEGVLGMLLALFVLAGLELSLP